MTRFDAFHLVFFAIILTREDGSIIFVNAPANEMLGYSGEELMGLSVEQLMPEGKRHGHIKQRHRYMTQPNTRMMNPDKGFELLRKDGSLFLASIGLAPINIDGEKLISVAIQDITKINEQAHRQAHQKRLEQMGEMSMAIAHNLNNLITGIKGQAYLLQKKLNSDRKLKRVRTISDLCDQSADMVKDILTYGQAHSEKKVVFDLSLSIDKAVEAISGSLADHISLESDNRDAPIHIFGQYSKFTQTLHRMIDNATYAIGKNDGKITVSSHICSPECKSQCDFKRVKPEKSVCIEIADTGCGISDDHIEKIFSPFFTTKPVGEGTGLGLSTSLECIQNHDGEISVFSKIGEGTTFRVHLPVFAGHGNEPDTVFKPRLPVPE